MNNRGKHDQKVQTSSILVSIPFRQHRCQCDEELLLTEEHPEIANKYLRALHQEILSVKGKHSHPKVSSVIFTGGPQQAFSAPDFYETILKIYRSFSLSNGMLTLVNLDPWGLNPTICSMLRNIGHILPNIRMFSCDKTVNQTINRGYPHHDIAYVADQLTYGNVKQFGVELFCGLPGQTEKSLLQSLNLCVDYQTALVTLRPFGNQWGDFLLAAENTLRQKKYRDLGDGRFVRNGFETSSLSMHNTEIIAFGISHKQEVSSIPSSLAQTVLAYISQS